MRKLSLLLALFLLGALDFAALDDITTGNEPSLVAEWFVVILSLPVIGAIGSKLRDDRRRA